MSDEPEIETNELQESVSELQEELDEERKERKAEKAGNAWTRWIALSTAILAVIAAVGALQSGALVNEAMIEQLQASDTWNEYQAARQKEDLFRIGADALLDRGAKPRPSAAGSPAAGGGSPGVRRTDGAADLTPLSPDKRLAEYMAQVRKEQAKEPDLRKAAEEHQKKAEASLHKHHGFAWSVALIQVAIALSAIAALTRIKPIWGVSLVIGLGGIVLFVLGLAPAGGK